MDYIVHLSFKITDPIYRIGQYKKVYKSKHPTESGGGIGNFALMVMYTVVSDLKKNNSSSLCSCNLLRSLVLVMNYLPTFPMNVTRQFSQS